MLWLLYKDYFKETIKINSYLPKLKWYVWLIFSLLMISTIGLFVTFIILDMMWFQVVASTIGASGGFYLGNELRRTVRKEVGTYEDIYDNNLITLRQIMQKRKIHNNNQIDFLLQQIDDELQDLKVSDGVFKQFYTIGTVILVPILTMLVKWILDKYTGGYYIVILITSILIMIISIFHMIKPLFEEILDAAYRKMKKLRSMIQDIKLNDFLN
jgi:hypothetical protein